MADDTFETVQPWMHPFPEAEEVFAGDVAAHRHVLQPLLSIDASVVNPAWTGRFHFVSPLEPDEGLLGQRTPQFQSGYCCENWIAFRVKDSRYEFLGNWRYFRINAGDEHSIRYEEPGYDHAALEKVYAEGEASFAESKRLFAETGKLHRPASRRDTVSFIDQVGGSAPDNNWISSGAMPVEEFLDEVTGDASASPLTEDGRRFMFVGSVCGYHYRDRSADDILLFFDPATSIAVMTLNWT